MIEIEEVVVTLLANSNALRRLGLASYLAASRNHRLGG
jgi:hypothetical protein